MKKYRFISPMKEKELEAKAAIHREKWKAEIKKFSETNLKQRWLRVGLTFKHIYKKLNWAKKGHFWR